MEVYAGTDIRFKDLMVLENGIVVTYTTATNARLVASRETGPTNRHD